LQMEHHHQHLQRQWQQIPPIHNWDQCAHALDYDDDDEYYPEIIRSAPQLSTPCEPQLPELSPDHMDHMETRRTNDLGSNNSFFRRSLPDPGPQSFGGAGTACMAGSCTSAPGHHVLPVQRPGCTAPGLAWMLLAAQSASEALHYTAGQSALARAQSAPPTVLSLQQQHQLPTPQQQHQLQAALVPGQLQPGVTGVGVRRDPVVTLRTVSLVPPPAPSAHHMLVRLHHQVSRGNV
jgi:hypothetical protein